MSIVNRPGNENRPDPRTTRKVSQPEAKHSKLDLQMAQQLKSAYTIERVCYESCRDGKASSYQPSKRWDGIEVEEVDGVSEEVPLENIWLKVAKDLHAKGIDPVFYVRRIFSTINGKLSSPPLPNQLLSNQSLQRYKKGVESLPVEIELAYKYQVSLAKTRILSQQTLYGRTMVQATLRVLTDVTLSLSALFRYCLARNMQANGFVEAFAELAEEYKVEAAIQYVRHQSEYSRIWGRSIPEDFKLDAQIIYESSVT